MAVNKRCTPSKAKNEEDDIRLDVDVWDVSIIEIIFHIFKPSSFNECLSHPQNVKFLRFNKRFKVHQIPTERIRMQKYRILSF